MLAIIVWTIDDVICAVILAVIAVVLLANYVIENIGDAIRTVFGFDKKDKKKGK